MDSTGAGENTRLREEVRYLRRRLQYLQSVSTVFRQRISLLLREVAEDPARVRELHAAYTALLSETALAEKQEGFDPRFPDSSNVAARSGSNNNNNNQFGSPNDNSYRSGSYNNNNAASFGSPIGGGGGRDPLRAKEDVRRAHHLCMILQERNELKKRELELEQVNRELISRLEDLEKNNGVARGTFSASAASIQQQTRNILNNNSITAFMDYNNGNTNNNNNNKKSVKHFDTSVVDTPAGRAGDDDDDEDEDYYNDNTGGGGKGNHKRSHSQETTSTTASSAIPGQSMLRQLNGGVDPSLPPQAAIAAIQRQNAFLKGRVQRLKQELDESMKQRSSAVTELQQAVDVLAAQTQTLKSENVKHQRAVAEANRAKLDAQKELLFQKSREELLLAKLDHNNNNNYPNYSSASANSSFGGGNHNNSESHQLVQVLSAQLQERDRTIGQCDNRINELEDELRECEAKRAAKEVEIVALGAQLKGLKARLDTFDAERSASQAQQSLVAEVHDRLLGAVVDIQRGANSETLAKSITDVSAKLDRLEGLEQQLRQKEDMLALADDEVARSQAMQQQLKDALAAFSPLFLQLPKSADALERLVIERDELLNEVRKSAQESRPADLNSVEGKVELRVLQTNQTRNDSKQHQQGGGTRGRNNNNNNNMNMPTIPPLPPLLDIHAEAHNQTNLANNNNNTNNHGNRQYNHDVDSTQNSARGGGGPYHNQQQQQQQQRSRIDAIPLTHLTPNDISATFRLFAPAKAGPDFRLGGEQLALCFAALGVPMPTRYRSPIDHQNNNNYGQQQQQDGRNNNNNARPSRGGVDEPQIAMTEAELVGYIVQQQDQ